ncbi:MAG: restriction endonuclease [Armatimonadetes bacterium]|nr:restriction endonuclease [Armatimonadota bacterium]
MHLEFKGYWLFVLSLVAFLALMLLAEYLKSLSKPSDRKRMKISHRNNARQPKTFNSYDFPWHNQRKAMDLIDNMTGQQFEEFLAELFTRLGCQVEITPAIKDHGADLIAVTPSGKRIAVQAKKLADYGNISSRVLGDLWRGLAWYKCTSAILVTNQFVTEQGKAEAKKFNFIIWDRPELRKKIQAAHNGKKLL